jgi:hypothetical protein
MPWWARRELYMVLIGCAMLVVSAVVLALNQDTSTELLGAIGAVGGLAVILNAILPANGRGEHSRGDPG